MKTQEAIESAIGLIWSEHHRWKHHDPKTGEHWKEVAITLEAEFCMDRIIERAKEATKDIREQEQAGEVVGSDVMNFVVR